MISAEQRSEITLSQTMCGIVSAGNTLVSSLITTYPSVALLLMRKDPDFDISEEQGSWMGASVPGFAIIGSLTAGYGLEVCGRSSFLKIVSSITLLSWSCLALSGDFNQAIAARVLSGLCLGTHQVATSVYFSETLHPTLRPLFLNLFSGLAWFFGFFLINSAGKLTDWRGLAWIGATISLLELILVFSLPETPYYLMKLNKPKEALETQKWLCRREKDAEKRIKDLKDSLSWTNEQRSVRYRDLLKSHYQWPFTMALVLHVFQQMSGVSPLTTFMGLILDQMGSSIDIGYVSFAITTVSIGAIFLGTKLLASWSRKSLISLSSQFIIIPLFIIYIYLWAQDGGYQVKVFGWVPPVCVIIYIFGYCLGWGPLPWIYIGESLPSSIREKGAGILVAINWACNFATTKMYSWATHKYGTQNIYLTFALMAISGMTIVKFYLPETVGFNDIELETYYKKSYRKKYN